VLAANSRCDLTAFIQANADSALHAGVGEVVALGTVLVAVHRTVCTHGPPPSLIAACLQRFVLGARPGSMTFADVLGKRLAHAKSMPARMCMQAIPVNETSRKDKRSQPQLQMLA